MMSLSCWSQIDTSTIIPYLEQRVSALEASTAILNDQLLKQHKSKDSLIHELALLRTQLSSEEKSNKELSQKIKELNSMIAEQQISITQLSQAEANVKALEQTVSEQKDKLAKYPLIKRKLLEGLQSDLTTYISRGNFDINTNEFEKIGEDISDWLSSEGTTPFIVELSENYEDWKRKSKVISDAREVINSDYVSEQVMKVLTSLDSLTKDENANVKSASTELSLLIKNYPSVYCRVRQGLEDLKYLSTAEYRLKDIETIKNWAIDYPFLLTILEEKKEDIMSNEHPLKKLNNCK